MTVAVFSDIHGNYHALKACYEDAIMHGAVQCVFLGDYVSDLSETRKTMDLVYEIRECFPTVCLRGNRERYMLECEQGISNFSRGSKTGSLLYTYENLSQQDLDFFRELNISDTIKIGGVNIEIAHAAKADTPIPPDEKKPRTVQTGFQPYKTTRRKSGTSGVYQLNDHLWEGKYSPRDAHGKRISRNVYAKTREECEEKLAELIKQMKKELAAEKEKLQIAK